MNQYSRGALAIAALLSPSECFNLPLSTSLVPSSRHGWQLTPLYSSVENEATETTAVTYSSSSFDPADDFTGDAPSKILGKPIPYSDLTVGVLKETYPGEQRVSIAPESAKMLVDAGLSVIVESGGEYFICL